MSDRYRIEPGQATGDYRIVDTQTRRIVDTAATPKDAQDALQAWVDENVCVAEGCDEPLDDGEGFDGYCGNHADVLESQGYWT